MSLWRLKSEVWEMEHLIFFIWWNDYIGTVAQGKKGRKCAKSRVTNGSLLGSSESRSGLIFKNIFISVSNPHKVMDYPML